MFKYKHTIEGLIMQTEIKSFRFCLSQIQVHDYETKIIHPLNFEIVPSNMHEMLRAAVEIGKCNSQLHRI